MLESLLRTSVSTLCALSQNSPAANTVLYHLRLKFEPNRLERVASTLLRRDLDELLPEQVKVFADLHLRPYYGDEDDTDDLYHSAVKRGTTMFHAYATLYARVKNKPYTLAPSCIRAAPHDSAFLAGRPIRAPHSETLLNHRPLTTPVPLHARWGLSRFSSHQSRWRYNSPRISTEFRITTVQL